MDFKPGDRLLCIEGFHSMLKAGQIYTADSGLTRTFTICIKEPTGIQKYWSYDRFVRYDTLSKLEKALYDV